MANTNYGQNGFLVQGASATQGPFDLGGGKYGVTYFASVTGTVGLSILAPDGGSTNFIPVTAATFTGTSGFAAVDLPSGLYQVTIATATGVNFSVTPISNRR